MIFGKVSEADLPPAEKYCVYFAYNHNEGLVGQEFSKRKEDLFFVKTDYWFNF
jgi:hypothetical protein